MNQWKNGARRRAVATAGLLLFVGAVAGVLVDRLWLLPRTVEATPLTVRAMAARLDLAPPEEARVLTLLDSMHAELLTAAEHGPDSLRTAARNAHQRLEAALPPRARPEFRAWIQDHHHQLIERMGDARMHAPGHLDE